MPSPYRRPHKAKNSRGNEVIDVEEYLKQFEDPEGLVQCSTAEEFRKGWRAMHKDSGSKVELSVQSSSQTRGQSRSQGQGQHSRLTSSAGRSQHIQTHDKEANIRTPASVHSKERQPPPPAKLARLAPISDPHPNSSTHPLKRPRMDLDPIDASSLRSTKTRTQPRSTNSAASSSSLVDLTKTRPNKQRRNYPAPISPPPRSPSASASA